MIRLDDVALSFGDVPVLDGVTLSVERGEFVAVVGPNGAGKTTLLRTINGVLSPDTGTVTLDDESITQMAARDISKQVATVPQDTHVGFSFTAEQIVEMGRTPHRSRLDWSDDADPVEQALSRTETTHLRDRQVDELSGGERQRILLARALAQEPAGLLLDEPTANLDINHQIQVLSLVSDLVSEDRTALAAIHDLELAARFCDRLVLLADGKIRARGPPEDVLTNPHLAAAFETTTVVTENPATGTPTLSAHDERGDAEGHVHVVGGGESALKAVRNLWQAGFTVTLGPAPEGSRAAALAARLGVDHVTAPPFEHPDEQAQRAALELAAAADVVVETDGPGGTVLADTVEHGTPQVTAALTADGEARIDGGGENAVTRPGAVVPAVETRIN